jgi:N-hydroxyarylamine O-acetyltransferase
LLLEVLRTLGFTVRPLSARVRFQQPPDVVTARTHLFLRVDLEGEGWLVDVGFGGFSLATAIRLGTEEPQDTPHEPRRIVGRDGRFYHQVRLGDVWHDLSEFTGEDMPLVDRELGNWFTSTHPTSSFRNRLVAARALPGGERLTLQNRELSHRRPGGVVDLTVIQTPEALLVVLAERFGLRFPAGTTFPCSGLDWPRP